MLNFGYSARDLQNFLRVFQVVWECFKLSETVPSCPNVFKLFENALIRRYKNVTSCPSENVTSFSSGNVPSCRNIFRFVQNTPVYLKIYIPNCLKIFPVF